VNNCLFLQEKGTNPLHVAAKFGQAAQCELLIVYGADLLALDSKGLSALDLANANKHSVIAERLLEAMYEVTDRISFFIFGKKPDHSVN
jgi:G protein-coupled receptor kinase interactor 2